jgi:hypothetical protein
VIKSTVPVPTVLGTSWMVICAGAEAESKHRSSNASSRWEANGFLRCIRLAAGPFIAPSSVFLIVVSRSTEEYV